MAVASGTRTLGLGLGPADARTQGHRLVAFVSLPDLAAIDAELVDGESRGTLKQLIEGHSLERHLSEVERRRAATGVGVKLPLPLAALAGVAQIDDEQPGAVDLDRGRGDVDRDLAAVSAARAEFDLPLSQPVVGFVDLTQQHGSDGRLQMVGEDQGRKLMTDRPGAFEAEELLGGAVPENHAAARVDDRNPFG